MSNLAIPALNPTLLKQASQLLLAPASLELRQLSDVLANIHVHHVDYADLYFQYSRMESWSLEEGIVKSGAFSIDRGVGVRARRSARSSTPPPSTPPSTPSTPSPTSSTPTRRRQSAFAYSDDISLDALTQAATATRAIGRQGQSAVAPLDRLGGARSLYAAKDPVAALGDAEKVMLLERLERIARARDPRVTQVMASLAGEYEAILIGA